MTPPTIHSFAPDECPSLEFTPRTRILFGRRKLDVLGDTARELGFRRTLVVSDPGVVRAGHVERGLESLRRAGIDASLFDGVEENPTTAHVDRGLAVARDRSIDSIVGLGGGSSMDCAKGINFLFSCGGRMEDYWGVGKATKPMPPLITVPTTAGTGSEAQSFALISDPRTHHKMACGDTRASAKMAILDPELTLSLPHEVTAATGMDALSHAVESLVTTRRNPFSKAFSREAWHLLASGFERVLKDPGDVDARGSMLLGACFAGFAIENSMLGAAHSLANPLTAHFDIPHGVAVGLMLPHVVRFNGSVSNGDYLELVALDPGAPDDAVNGDGAAGVATRLEELRVAAAMPTRLVEFGLSESHLAELSEEASRQWTAQFNPRPVSRNDLEDLYRCAL